MLSVSIIIPSYNERDNISILARELSAILAGRDYEIIVVDDNSPDGTGKVVRSLKGEIPALRLITRKKKEGIGAALRCGYNEARCDILLSMDADLSWSTNDIPRLLSLIDRGADMALGSRHMEGGAYEAPSWNIKLKRLVSTLGNKVVRFTLGAHVRDYSSNFRAIRARVWHEIETRDNSNSLLIETVLKAAYGGYDIREVPVAFKNRIHGCSKLNFYVEVPKFLVKLIYFALAFRLFGVGIPRKTA